MLTKGLYAVLNVFAMLHNTGAFWDEKCFMLFVVLKAPLYTVFDYSTVTT